MTFGLTNNRWLGKSIGAISCCLLSALAFSSPANAAERISVRISGAQRALDVADLDFFVRTGDIPRSLRWYADRLTDDQIAELREILQKPLNVEPRVVSKFVYDSVGETLLMRLNGLFWGGNPDSNFKALRSALVLASYDEEGLTILNAIRKYPLRDLRINLDPVLKAANDLQDILVGSNRIFDYIEDQAATGVTSVEAFLAELPDPREPGEFKWSQSTIRITNPNRPPGQTVLVDMYVPQNLDEPAPLIVISHGMASTRKTFAYLAEHLASQGFAVAAVEHPSSSANRFQQYIAGFAEEPEPGLGLFRPQDITALLDYLEQDVSSNPAWQGSIRTDRVGIVGQSLGGYTALAAGGAQLDFDYLREICSDDEQTILPFNLSLLLQCRMLLVPEEAYEIQDERIAAVLAINPVNSAVFGPDGLSQIDVPVMMVAGTKDFFAPAVDEQLVPFTWLQTENRYLLLVDNGTHFSFLPGDSSEEVFNLPQELIGPDPQLAHPGMQGTATVFFHTYIADTDEYAPYLTEFLLTEVGGGEFSFAMTRSLAEEEIQAAKRSK